MPALYYCGYGSQSSKYPDCIKFSSAPYKSHFHFRDFLVAVACCNQADLFVNIHVLLFVVLALLTEFELFWTLAAFTVNTLFIIFLGFMHVSLSDELS